jgi:hypothetical protein
VSRSFEGFQANPAYCDDGAVGKRCEAILRFRFGTQIDRGTDAVAELQVACDEIGVEMGEKDVFDLQIVLCGEGQVTIDVALGIDHGGDARLFVADEVGGVGQAVQIELMEDHCCKAINQSETRTEPKPLETRVGHP